jgi:pantetheine-phosphate adenylyltransferase
LILDKWNEPHRYYHGLNHLSDILNHIKNKGFWTPDHGHISIYLLSAVFHDIINDPTRNDNEEKSVEFLMDNTTSPYREMVADIILDTKTGVPRSEISKIFIEMDRYDLIYGDFSTILTKNRLLFKEQQHMDFIEWRTKQIEFLSTFLDINPNVKDVIEFLKIWQPKIGVYPGSFNPYHNGHQNILQKAERIFDKVIIAHGINPDKNTEDWIKPDVLKYHQVENFSGLLTDFMNGLNYETTLIRGLRNSTDLQFEMTQFQYLQDMKPNINIVNIFCDKEFEHISSSAIRNLNKIDTNLSKKYLP